MDKEYMPERLTNKNFFAPWTSFNVQRYQILTTWSVHWHEFYELEFITQGEGLHIINGIQQPLTTGSLVFLTPADFHEISPRRDTTMELINVKFSEEVISNELRELILGSPSPYYANFSPSDFNRIEADFMRLLSECDGNAIGKELVLQGTLERIIIDLIRYSNTELSRKTTIPKPLSPSNHSIHRSLSFLQHHFREPLSLEQVAQESNMSANYFSEFFHKSTGKTFKSYLHELRINFAASLIKCSFLPVTEICFASGFNTLPHFLRSFKQHFGMSPNNYRKQYSEHLPLT